MARKGLLKGLMEAPTDTPAEATPDTRVDAARPRYTTGAIGAVSQSIADLKARSLVEVDPRMIDNAGMRDRLGEDAEIEALMGSIRDYGQQVPVLLRPNPNNPERYQVVYGRRRVAALKALGQPVKAMVRVLDDRALVLAQGQENAARKDLSFIEKANFARQMRDAGYERKVICAALHMDKTLISRMLSVADRVPPGLIEAIGAAPSVGRDRWLALAERIGDRDLVASARGDSSDARFDAVMAELKAPRPPAPQPVKLATDTGEPLATLARKSGRLVVNVEPGDGFDDWLAENLTRLHRDWQQQRD